MKNISPTLVLGTALTISARSLIALSGEKELKPTEITGSFPEGEVFSMDENEVYKLKGEEIVYSIRDSQDGRAVIGEGIGIIHAPPGVVYDVLVDFENYKKWMPTITYSKVRDKTGDITTVDMKHSMPLVGIYDCQQRYRTLEKEGEKIVDFYITICIVKASKGRYCLHPASDPQKTILKFYQEITPSKWMPKFLLKIITKKMLKDTFGSLNKRIDEIAERK